MKNDHEYIEKLIANCKAAKAAIPTQEIAGDQVDLFKGVKNSIYVIREIGGDPDKTFKNFLKFKKSKLRNCPTANQPSQVLYVGSSIGNLANRLKQHIGPSRNEKTYALHLNCWFKGRIKITANTFDIFPSVIQIIENSLHHHLKPAFGKKGGNFRSNNIF